MDCSLPGFSVRGILQARTLEWVAISFSNAWKWKVKVKSLSHAWLLVTPWTVAYQAPPSMGFSRQEYWSGVPLPSPSDSTVQQSLSTAGMCVSSCDIWVVCIRLLLCHVWICNFIQKRPLSFGAGWEHELYAAKEQRFYHETKWVGIAIPSLTKNVPLGK